MMKWLLIAVVVGLVVWWLTRGRRAGPERPRPKAEGRPPAGGPPQPMIRCAHCGVLLPQADAIAGPKDHAYCSPEHLRLGPGGSDGTGS